ncbi:MAG TPA: VCBS repeat-containing protein [Puia sp.]|nr:VCBS repeat-containing protein [Puia sp.]
MRGFLVLAIFAGCHSNRPDTTAQTNTLFRLLDSSQTHIGFTNTITETADKNILLYQYFYNGAGVAVGDLNGDGLQDIYFTGNTTDDKLYLNKGHLRFDDVTDIAGVAGRSDGWKTGVTLVDINGDDKLDIYVCYSGPNPLEKRRNQLFINQGNDPQGIPHFTEEAEKYGLADGSFSTQAYFFDYDGDGDLDMLLLDHNPRQFTHLDDSTVPAIEKIPDPMSGTKLYRNDNGHFTDVTLAAGIQNSGLSYGLGAGIADIDGDGWPDIYISNDYAVPDHLYINRRNGTFTDELRQRIGHTSLFSMGNDIADINNDGLPDIYTLDMLPESNLRQKTLFTPDNYAQFEQNIRVGFYYQYMRNMLQLNNGNGTFSEIGQIAGVSTTDWSWAPLFADFDNDGRKDLFVTNGLLHDLTNSDFVKYRGDLLASLGKDIRPENILQLLQHMPSSQLKSYLFRNTGDGHFADSSRQWGITLPANSNGAAYADLDNDGDLDLVVNNIGQPAFIYENTSDKTHHYLELKLEGRTPNTQGIGARVMLYYNHHRQMLEQMPARGYQSSVSPVLHFGTGTDRQIDSLCIIWRSGKQQTIGPIKADTLLTLKENDAPAKESDAAAKKSNVAAKEKDARPTPHPAKPETPVFKAIPPPISDPQPTTTINDFKRQPLMVSPMSFSTPCMIKGDVNGDGLVDVFIGGGYGKAGKLFLQQRDGSFRAKNEPALGADHAFTDAAAVFLDANGDGTPDLYVCSGGYDNLQPDDSLLQDRLYLNDGKGNFTRAGDALPPMPGSKGCVAVADIDGDGHPDLFVGGRVIPGRYPETPESYVLINNGKGHFTDKTTQLAPNLRHIGMVTAAVFSDFNADGRPDLVLAGEWMPITILLNEHGRLTDHTTQYLPQPTRGWWNTLLVTDLNHDGHPDIIAGNIGLNTQCRASVQEPAELYYKDFDNNGTIDPILCFYVQHQSYPWPTRDELTAQLNMMTVRFPDYESYAHATIHELFTPEELKDAGHLQANLLETSCFLSNASGALTEHVLPTQAQYAPVYTITPLDYNKDGNIDLLLCGNRNKAPLRFGKADANYGILLKGDGKGGFEYITQNISGFDITGDVRSVIDINGTLLFAINQSLLKAYKP